MPPWKQTEEQLGQEIKRLQHKYKEIKKRKLHLHALIDLETLVFQMNQFLLIKLLLLILRIQKR